MRQFFVAKMYALQYNKRKGVLNMFLSPHPGVDATASEMLTYFSFILGFVGVMLLIFEGIPYILESIAYYRMAQLRKIPRPWLAWIPIARGWLLGSISDHYQEKVKMKPTNRRKWLLILGSITAVSAIVLIFVYFSLLLEMIQSPQFETYYQKLDQLEMSLTGNLPTEAMVTLLRYSGIIVLASGVSIAYSVFYYIARFDMFRSCDPSNAVLFLVLSIVLPMVVNWLAFVPSILVFISRFKTYGIPSRPPEGWKSPEEQDWQKPEQIDWQHNRPDDPWKL